MISEHHAMQPAALASASWHIGATARRFAVRASNQTTRRWRSPLDQEERGTEIQGPILPDYLRVAEGASDATATERPIRPRPTVAKQMPREDASQASPSSSSSSPAIPRARFTPMDTPAVKLRRERLVQAEMTPGTALPQDIAKPSSRTPLPISTPGRPMQIPPVFEEAYDSYARGEEGSPASDQSTSPSDDNQPKEKLRVMEWHRSTLQKLMCKSLLHDFYQDLRRSYPQLVNDRASPLWVWEAKRAEDLSEKVQLLQLVKYLATVELHINRGEKRGTFFPGSKPRSQVEKLLAAERRSLHAELEASVERVLKEDALIRLFLDGKLSWPRTRQLLFDSPPKAPTNALAESVSSS